jgi:hypothetical protein
MRCGHDGMRVGAKVIAGQSQQRLLKRDDATREILPEEGEVCFPWNNRAGVAC